MTVSSNPNPYTVEFHADGTYLAGVITSDERDFYLLENVIRRLQASGVLVRASFDIGRNGMLAFRLGSFVVPDEDVYNDVNVVAELLASLLNKEAAEPVRLPPLPEYVWPRPGPGPDQHD